MCNDKIKSNKKNHHLKKCMTEMSNFDGTGCNFFGQAGWKSPEGCQWPFLRIFDMQKIIICPVDYDRMVCVSQGPLELCRVELHATGRAPHVEQVEGYGFD